MTKPDFDLTDFLPYLLNQAAERTALSFQATYKARYGILRTEWRVIFHLGRYGPMTAKEICDRARTHKTKVSRAVAALEDRRYLIRTTMPEDRRNELLELTRAGRLVFDDLLLEAQRHDDALSQNLTPAENRALRVGLRKLAGFVS
jgi:DNA-binding MarR family transcriptional regulator